MTEYTGASMVFAPNDPRHSTIYYPQTHRYIRGRWRRFIPSFFRWGKAFDSIDQEELINAVWRMNVPNETIREFSAMYASIKFKIKDGEGFSSEREQRTGIRQGCPLSPYLFIILMTAMFMDVHDEVGKRYGRQRRMM
jgi:hypothetical protein